MKSWKLHINDVTKPENKNWLFTKVCEKIEELNTHPKFGFDTLEKMKEGKVWLKYVLVDKEYVDMEWTGL